VQFSAALTADIDGESRETVERMNGDLQRRRKMI
jgi:hypothetical protein